MVIHLDLIVISGIREPVRSSSPSFRQNIARFLWNPNWQKPAAGPCLGSFDCRLYDLIVLFIPAVWEESKPALGGSRPCFRSFMYLFELLKQRSDFHFLEIYNEKVCLLVTVLLNARIGAHFSNSSSAVHFRLLQLYCLKQCPCIVLYFTAFATPHPPIWERVT